jgi:hypothetical protein
LLPRPGADMVRATTTTLPAVLRVNPALGSRPSCPWQGMMPATPAVMINWKFHQVPISLLSDPHKLTAWRKGL